MPPTCSSIKVAYEEMMVAKKEFSSSLKSRNSLKEVKNLKAVLEQKKQIFREVLIEPRKKELARFGTEVYSVHNNKKEDTPIALKSSKERGDSFLQEIKEEPSTFIENPETIFLNYEAMMDKIEIFDPNQSIELDNWLKERNRSKTIASVMDYVHTELSSKYYLPGMEFQEFMTNKMNRDINKLPKNTSEGFKNSKPWFYLPGSAFRSSYGDWSVPCGHWDGSEWDRRSYWVELDWVASERVLLVRRGLKNNIK